MCVFIFVWRISECEKNVLVHLFEIESVDKIVNIQNHINTQRDGIQFNTYLTDAFNLLLCEYKIDFCIDARVEWWTTADGIMCTGHRQFHIMWVRLYI